MQTAGPTVLSVGEILMDVDEDTMRAQIGGAPFNFAFHLFSLGAEVAFVSKVKDDELGKQILATLNRHQFPTRFIQLDHYNPTGRVLVREGSSAHPQFEIEDNVAFDYIEWSVFSNDLNDTQLQEQIHPDLVYYGTLAQRDWISRNTIKHLFTDDEDAIKFFDINLRPPHYSRHIIEDSLHASTILKLNVDEFKTLQEMFDLPANNTDALQKLQDEFELKAVCLTMGQQGSLLLMGNTVCSEKAHTPKDSALKALNTVGAGDAFAAILALGIIQQWSPETILCRASDLAADICTVAGAIPEERSFYNRLRAELAAA